MNNQQVEQEIQTKGKTAPRVTPEDIEANIIDEVYFTAEQGYQAAMKAQHPDLAEMGNEFPNGTLRLLTFCVLTLRNGFTVTGESACASPENFDAEIGRKVARANAVQKIWPLMGYELKSKLAAQPKDFRDRVRAEFIELDERITKLSAFLLTEMFGRLPEDEQDRMAAQLAAMRDYSGCLADRISAFDKEAAK